MNDFKAADLNGDGRLDLVTVNDDHSVSVILNQGPCRASRRRAVRVPKLDPTSDDFRY